MEITFDSEPLFIAISTGYSGTGFVPKIMTGSFINPNNVSGIQKNDYNDSRNDFVTLNWNNTNIGWYSSRNEEYQLNKRNNPYYYVVFF